MNRNVKPWFILFYLSLPIAFFTAYLVINFSSINIPYDEYSDYALNAIQIEKAKQFKEYLGPYSRFGFNHLGPISYYVYALFEKILPFMKSAFSQHIVAQYLLNVVFGLMIFLIVYFNSSHKWAISVYFLLFLLALAPLGSPIFLSIWGPGVIIFPFGLFLVSAAGFSMGKLDYLLGMTVAAVFMVHNHVGPLPIIGMITLAALIFFMRNHVNGWRFTSREKIFLGLSMGFLLITSVPPFYQQLTAEWGNFAKLYGYMRHQPAINHGFFQSLQFVVAYFSKTIPLPGLWLMPLLLGLSLINLRAKKEFMGYLTIVNVVALVGFVLTGMKIKDGYEDYLFWFAHALVGLFLITSFNGIVIVGKRVVPPALSSRIQKYSFQMDAGYKYLLVMAIVFAGAFFFVGRYYTIPQFKQDYRVDKIVELALTADDVSYYIHLIPNSPHHRQWPVAAGVVLKLYRSGKKTYVTNDQVYATLFSNNFLYHPQSGEKIMQLDFYNRADWIKSDYPKISEYHAYEDLVVGIKKFVYRSQNWSESTRSGTMTGTNNGIPK